MNSPSLTYKSRAFEGRNLAFYFLIVFGLQGIQFGLLRAGVIRMPSVDGPAALLESPGVILIVLGAWGPFIAAFLVSALTEGKAGVKALWKRFWNRNINLKWLLVCLLTFPVLFMVTNLVLRVTDGMNYPFFVIPNPPWMLLTAFIGAFIGSGIAEEFGWRGYVLPRFQARWNALASSLVLGVIWVCWHLDSFFLPGATLYGRNFLPWAALTVMGSVLYTWIFNHTKGSVLAAALLHALGNVSIIWVRIDWRYVGVLFLAVVLVVVIFGPKTLVRKTAEEGIEGKSLGDMS